jgi:hypothetical protein
MTASYSFGILFFIFALTPWVSFGLNNLDSQPWTFIAALIFYLFIAKRVFMPHLSFLLITTLLIGLLITIYSGFNFNLKTILRSSISYLSFPIFYIGFYNYFLKFGFPKKTFISVNIIWILLGVFELFIPDIGGLFSEHRNAYGRGVTSLAPEPTFFGIYLFFSSWILLESEKFVLNAKTRFLIFLNFISVIFLAQSSMVLLFYSLAGAFFICWRFFSFRIPKKSFIMLLFIFIFVCPIIFLSPYVLEGSRIYSIVSLFIKNPSLTQIILTDGSISQRAADLYFSVFGMLNNYLLPGGLDTFNDMRSKNLTHTGDYFWWLTPSDKIMSWVGAFMYELGIFGLVVLFVIFKISYQNTRTSKFSLALLVLILFSAIPVAFPLVPMLFAMFTFNKGRNHSKRIKILKLS